MRGIFILGDQLFAADHLKDLFGKNSQEKCKIFMAEDFELCSRFECHKHKLVFFLSAMRHYRTFLQESKHDLTYHELQADFLNATEKRNQRLNYESKLENWVQENKITELVHFEISDSFFKTRIAEFCKAKKLKQTIVRSPMFIESSLETFEYMSKLKKPFMKNFYEKVRNKSGILMEKQGEKLVPQGGQYSFDTENRSALPKGKIPPNVTLAKCDSTTEDVKLLVNALFSKHPGTVENFWLPVTRKDAHAWLSEFFKQRFSEFGDYEDALSQASPFLYHSVLTPFLNSGLLTPQEVVNETLKYAKKHAIPLNSLEGFVRQIVGWREFIRGINLAFEEKQNTENFFGHKRKMAPCWWNGTTGLLHLDRAIKKTAEYGYCHHIERLMVLGNTMLLCELEPSEVHAWFMQMFVDSADWVMGPNVYGMALFSDGGIFATKPYICGSNYWLKMSGDKKESWCEDLDSLYWSFVHKKRDFLIKNPRMSMMVRTFDKILPERKDFLLKNAEVVLKRLTR